MPNPPPTVRVVWARSTSAAAVTGLLDDGERARLGALRRAADADSYASAHALLRVVVGDTLGRAPAGLVLTATCRTCGGPHGRPGLADAPGLHLGLTHAAGLVAVAVSTVGPVGVDVEALSATDFDGFDAVALAPGERAHGPAQRARTWVRKEALLKATGHGLVVEPTAVVLSDPDQAPRLVSWNAPEPPGPVRLRDVPLDGRDHAAAVAVVGADRWDLQVVEQTW